MCIVVVLMNPDQLIFCFYLKHSFTPDSQLTHQVDIYLSECLYVFVHILTVTLGIG